MSLTSRVQVSALRSGAIENIIIALAVALLLMRFWRLGDSPPGFYTDEMMAAANTFCLRHTGVDVWGNGWSLSSGGAINDYGFVVGIPLHANVVYASWFFLAGDSIVATRALEVVISLVTVVSTIGIAYNLLGRRTAIWTLALAASSPWMWSLSRVAFLHPEFFNAHFFLGGWILSCHLRRGDEPTRREFVAAGLLFGVGLFGLYSIFATMFITLLFLTDFLITRRTFRPLAVFCGSLIASYLIMQLTVGQYSNTRVGQMGIFGQLSGESSIIGKATTLVTATWDQLLDLLSLSFLVFNGDRNLRHHSGWGGMLSWPQILLILLLPAAVVVCRTIAAHKREIRMLTISVIGALGGLLPAAVAGESTPHANRSLVAAPFVVLGCAAIGTVLTPFLKKLPALCLALGLLFVGLFGHDYFTQFPKRAEGYFQVEVRRAGENAQATGDFGAFYAQLPQFMNRYGVLADRGLIFFEAAGSGRGCPRS